MIRLLLFIVAAFLLWPLRALDGMAQYQCDPTACTLPDCHCASVDAPGGLLPSETPQFILLTFDDGVMEYWESFVGDLTQGLQNPGGRKALRTYFVNVKDTDPNLIRTLYLEGHEMANHTATHNTGTSTTAAQWVEEIRELNAFLRDVAGIPLKDVVGFRAPYLATNEAMWQTLGQQGLLYDSSVGEQPTYPPTVSLGLDRLVWPHTMDYGLPLSCYSSACPEEPVPGLWTIPMWAHFEDPAVAPNGMDPYAGFPEKLQKALELGFDQRYHGNRAPLGLYLHRGPLAAYPGWTAELRAFLETALETPDVWMITMRGLIEWMKAPVAAAEMGAWYDAACYTGACAGSGTDAEDLGSSAESRLHPLYPNPLYGAGTVVFDLAESSYVQLAVYDMLGRRVADMAGGWYLAGRHEASIDGAALAAGPYVIVMEAGGIRHQRMAIVAD